MKKPTKPIMLPNLGRKDIIPDKIKSLTKQKKQATGQPEIVRRLSDPKSPEKQQIKKNATEMREVKKARSSLTDWNKTVHGHIEKSLPLMKLETVKLPTIEEIHLIFQEHHNKLGVAFRNNKWGEIPAIEAETKKKLHDIGIGLYIDFTPDEDKKVWDEKVKALANK